MSHQPIDFLVETRNPEALDDTFQRAGRIMRASVVGRGTPEGITRIDGHVVVRVLFDPGFFEYVCQSQGYCRVVRKL